jgi:putative transposase
MTQVGRLSSLWRGPGRRHRQPRGSAAARATPSGSAPTARCAPGSKWRAVPFRSRLREIIRGRTEELEALAVEMYARGLSTRDIEALFADERGRSLLSRTAVSEITERLWA